MSISKCRIVMFVLFLNALIPHSSAQSGPAIGTPNNGSFVGTVDKLNLGNLNVNLTIPLFTKMGRGINYEYDLTYDSSLWMANTGAWIPRGGNKFGWQAGPAQSLGGYGYAVVTSSVCQQGQFVNKYITTWSDFSYVTPDGVVNTFSGSTTYNQCNGATAGLKAQSSHGYSLAVSAALSTYGTGGQLTDPSGNRFGITFYTLSGGGGPASSIVRKQVIDPNANTAYSTSTANQFLNYADTSGNVPLLVTADIENSVGGNEVDTQLPATLQYTDPNGKTQTINVQYQSFNVQTNFGYSGILEYPITTTNLPTGVTMPDGSSYSFTYEATPGYSGSVTGRLASVTLPTGGVIRYQYTGGYNGVETDGSISGLNRSTSDGSVSYVRSNVVPATTTNQGNSTTTVTDPYGNQTVIAFEELPFTDNFYETSRLAYAGQVGGTLLRSVSTCYNSNASSCNSQSLAVPFTEVYKKNTLETGLSSSVDDQFDATGNLTQEAQYDFGASSPTKTTTISYASLGNNILNRPSAITETDNSGNQLSSTTLSYDDSSCTLVATSGLPEHSGVSGSRGNLTTITRWINSPSGSLVTHICYDDAGKAISTTDPSGNITQYNYDSATDTFLTGVTYPTPASGVALSTSATSDPNTGVVLSVTDSNSQQTIFSYDSMARPTLITYPKIASGTPTKSFAYPSPNQVNVTSPMGNGSSITVESLLDPYGRTSRSALYNGQSSNSYYQQDTCYDSSGRPSFTSLPYQGAGFSQSIRCSGQGDQIAYDAIDRPSKITHTDGSYFSYIYGGRTTELIDEGNGAVQSAKAIQSDGFGRPVSVCEITGTALVGSGSPQACGMDLGGLTGYVTSYAYSLAQHSSTITQGVQTRIFQTDSLNRLVSVQEPELASAQASGVTTYAYSYNSTGLVGTRTSPQANQTNASAKTVRTTQYDQLGRMLTRSYNDGITASATYTYDVASVAGQTITNPKGRLVAATASNTQNVFSYDALGNIVSEATCLPGQCPSAFLTQAFGYDLTGDLTSRSDGNGTTYAYGYSPAAELTSLSSSLVNSTHPAVLFTNAQYGPFGILSRSLIAGSTETYSYDVRGRRTGSSVTSSTGTTLSSDHATFAADNLVTGSSSTVQGNWQYSYDAFNRLTCADSNTCSSNANPAYQFAYDRWGNRLSETPGASPGTNFATNQFSAFSYDAAGNRTSDAIHNYTFDAEGRIVSVDGGSTASYLFDASGGRVQTVEGGTTTQNLYDPVGNPVSVWSGASTFVRGNVWSDTGKEAYYTAADTYALHSDWVGTVRLQLESQGTTRLFGSMPFGDAPTNYNADADTLHFGLLDSDSASGLSHSDSRDYSPTLGQWTSMDRYLGSYDVTNPQSFNRYTYALNQPLSSVDPSGFIEEAPPGGASANSGALPGATCLLCFLRGIIRGLGDLFGPGGGQGGLSDFFFTGGIATGSTHNGAYQDAASLPAARAVQTATGSNGVTIIHNADGSTETRTGGSASWRNHNPGNEGSGYGAIGTAHIKIKGVMHSFAIYPNDATGWKALDSNLHSLYMGMSIGAAMKVFAPGSDGNNPVAYANSLGKAVGVPVSTRVGDLSPAQLNTFEHQISVQEGFPIHGTSTILIPQ